MRASRRRPLMSWINAAFLILWWGLYLAVGIFFVQDAMLGWRIVGIVMLLGCALVAVYVVRRFREPS